MNALMGLISIPDIDIQQNTLAMLVSMIILYIKKVVICNVVRILKYPREISALKPWMFTCMQ